MKPVIIIAIAVLIVSVSITSISAQTQSDIPSWVKGVADFWVKGNISDNEFGEAISFLIEQEILNVEIPQQANNLELEHKISQLESENTKLRLENTNLKNENSKLQSESNSINPSNQDPITQKEPSTVKSKDIRDLLPNESDIGKKWKIFDTGTLTANSKTFHFETGRVSNYSKDVSILKKFVMAVYQFSDVDSAKEGLEWQRFDVRTKDGGYNGEKRSSSMSKRCSRIYY